jgi:tetratricopeptide (TPR) repeat protein
MKHLYALLTFASIFVAFSNPCFADQLTAEDNHTKAAMLNNEGVQAVNERNYQFAIEKFTKALELDPTYNLAHENLAMAHNNYGIALANDPPEALKQFHEAAYLRMNTERASANLENINSILRVMGKDPKLFIDRVKLGDEERTNADWHGAIVEYSLALQLQDDQQVHKKLGDIYKQVGQNDKAKSEYAAADRATAAAAKSSSK